MSKIQNTHIELAKHQMNDRVLEQAVEHEFIQLNATLRDLYATVSRFAPSLYSESIVLKARSQQVLTSFNDNINQLRVFRQIKERQLPLNNWENEGGSVKYD